MKHSFIPYAKQSINRKDCEAVLEALQADVITRGEYVIRFENSIAKYCGAKYAVCFSSGTTALHAAYFAAGIRPSYQVTTSPNTFIGTFVGAMALGGEINFVDIRLENGNLDTAQIEEKEHHIIAPVHFSGIPVDIRDLREKFPKAILIEDAAHALGSYSKEGIPIGSCSYSDMTVLSFHPAKTITTGEGGMVTTNKEDYCERLKLFRNNGITRDDETFPGCYRVEMASGNYNFTDFQAALGLSQLGRITEFVSKRKKLVETYRHFLQGIEAIRLFSPQFDSLSAHHLFVVQIDFSTLRITRKELMHRLRSKNIGTQVHYIPAYHHPLVRKIDPCPQMERYFSEALTLPLYFDLEPATVEMICDELITAIKS